MNEREELNSNLELNSGWKYEEILPTFSAYVTAYNCLKNGYPILEAVKSFAWCDEVVVVDGGSTDGTVEALQGLGMDNLCVYPIPLDWENPGKDGAQKAMARAMCSKEFSIQFDADEICLGSEAQWRRLAKEMVGDILQLPILEPFGRMDSLRLNSSHNPVKWRITRNKPEITHGIPKSDQEVKDGKTFSKGFSDGCNYIHIVTENPYPSKISKEAFNHKNLYLKASSFLINPPKIEKDESAIDLVENYKLNIERMLEKNVPLVLHVGHVNLEHKIKLFLNEWRHWWSALYGKGSDDISSYFPLPTSIKEIEEFRLNGTLDEFVRLRALELKRETPVVLVEKMNEQI